MISYPDRMTKENKSNLGNTKGIDEKRKKMKNGLTAIKEKEKEETIGRVNHKTKKIMRNSAT